MIAQQILTLYQSQFYAWLLTRRATGDTVESLASTLVDSQVDLNPHQVEAALFACSNSQSHGIILADEVRLRKTIEAGRIVLQCWVGCQRRMPIIRSGASPREQGERAEAWNGQDAGGAASTIIYA